MLVNDEDREVEAMLTLALENSQMCNLTSQTAKFKIVPLGQLTLYNDFKFPANTGDFLLHAIIQYPESGQNVSPQSRGKVRLVEPARQ
jgi:hypothetical protein